MFRGGQPNPYDEIVVKTTDENLTSENWELILNLCDRVQDEGEQGARNVINAVLKRFAHRNPNVQLYALALVEALSKNCGINVHREIASRSFTQGLERLVTDRTSHDKVKRKALSLISMWTIDFENDPTLGIMEECYDDLKGKGYKFEEQQEPPPPQVDDEIRRREEEELQRVLEMSVHDKGGRPGWDSSYSGVGGSSSKAGPSTSSSKPSTSSSKPADTNPPSRYGTNDYGYAKSTSGYVPARTPSPEVRMTTAPVTAPTPAYTATPSPQTQMNSSSQSSLPLTSVSRVRALHTFEGSEQGELSFVKGDIIKVVDRNYKDWWRGQLKGRTGIFPVNYVELLPDPTPEEIAREAEQEAAIFAQAANIDKLLNMLRGFDPERDNLADNEEIQELYHNGMTLRPKIVKLIEKYSQKRDELVLMNDAFVKARTMFNRMMEESLARHTGLYDTRFQYQPSRQDNRATIYGGGFEQGYPGYPQPNAGYQVPVAQTPGPQPYSTPAYAAQQHGYGAYPAQPATVPYGPQEAPSYSPYGQPPLAQPTSPQPQPQVQIQQQTQSPQAGVESMYSSFANMNIGQPQQTPQAQASAAPQYTQQPQPQQNGYVEPIAIGQPQVQIQGQPQPQQQIQQQPHSPVRTHTQGSQPEPQSPGSQQQSQLQGGPKLITQGPPYIFDPTATYPDPNAQAWAQYYAQGGTDLTGSVYFISIPGLKEPVPSPSAGPQTHGQVEHAIGQQLPYGQETERKTSYGSVEAQLPAQSQLQSQPQSQPQPQAQIQPQVQTPEAQQHYPIQIQTQAQSQPPHYQVQPQLHSPQQQHQQPVQIPTQPQPQPLNIVSSSPVQTQMPQSIYQEPASTAAI